MPAVRRCWWRLCLLLCFVGVAQSDQLSEARSNLAAAAAGTRIVFAGGYGQSGNSATVDIYDLSTGAWTSTQTGAGSLSQARYDIAASSIGTKLVFAGGCLGAPTYSAVVDIYDVVSGQWTSTSLGAGSLSQARSVLGVATAGSWSVFGGGDAGGVYSSMVDIYNGDTGTWTSTATGAGQLSEGRSIVPAASAGPKVVFAGGLTTQGASATVDIYDVSTRQWTSTSLGAGALSVARWMHVAAAAGNQVVFGGGWTGSAYTTTVDIYNVITGAWTSSTHNGIGALSVPREWGRSVLKMAAVGSLIVFAGGLTSNGATGVMDILDTNTGQWNSTAMGAGSLSEPRWCLATASVETTMLIAGGCIQASPGVSAAVDVFDLSGGMNAAMLTSTASVVTTQLSALSASTAARAETSTRASFSAATGSSLLATTAASAAASSTASLSMTASATQSSLISSVQSTLHATITATATLTTATTSAPSPRSCAGAVVGIVFGTVGSIVGLVSAGLLWYWRSKQRPLRSPLEEEEYLDPSAT